MLTRRALGGTSITHLAIGAIGYCIVLILTIHGGSLWTDEAFSAYIADHKTLHSLLSTLVNGDSSDLQVAMYYIYLHGWTLLFGSSELALRAANIPFILIFGATLVWTSVRIFRAAWLWIPAGSLPFLWIYASQARAYFALVAFSMVCFGCFLAYLDDPSEAEQRWLPWLALGSLFLGTTFHMLMLLVVPPLLLVAIVYRWNGRVSFASWRPAVLAFSIPFVLLLSYLIWTFVRGTAYDYSRPDILSMGSVFYRLVGLSGYGPNRRYDIPFRPYLAEISLASFVLAIGAAAAVIVALRAKDRLRFVSLSLALLIAVAEVIALSIVSQEQLDLRHLGAIVPLLIVLLLAALSETAGQTTFKLARTSALLIFAVWMVADYRFLFLPEYRDEDFRSTVKQAVDLHRQFNASIALVADPAAGAYYGLDLQGRAPCFPLLDDCASGFRKVAWPRKAPADYAYLWKPDEIRSWIRARLEQNTPVVVIISRSRFPGLKDSPWWPILSARPSVQYSEHGFSVYLLR